MGLAQFRIGTLALVAVAGAALALMLPTPGFAGATPRDLLQNGLDALADDQATEARASFNKLISAYPQSMEAAQAKRELNKLDDAGQVVPDGDDAANDQNDQTATNPADTDMPANADAAAGAATASPAGAKSSNTPTLRARRAFVTAVGDRVFFAESSASIGGRARATLQSQGRWLAQHPTLKITLIGRADDGGTAAQASELSQQRAEAVRAKLIESGVAAEAVAVEARGSTDPVATCRSALCQAQNRLVETLITVVPPHQGASAFDPAMPRPAGAGTAVSAQTPGGLLAR